MPAFGDQPSPIYVSGSPDLPGRTPPLPVKEREGRIVRDVGRSLKGAAKSLSRAVGGSAKFGQRAGTHVPLALIQQLQTLLPMLEKYPTNPDPDARYIPTCPLCQAPPGNHWAHECPSIAKEEKYRAKYVFDYRTKTLRRYKDLEAEPDPRDYAPHMIPRCGVCGKGPGAHWPDRCPDNPIREKMWGDRVVPPSEQEANRKEMEEWDD